MREPPVRNSGGFTLLEILVAVFIFAVVMTTLFSSFDAFVLTGQTLTSSVAFRDSLRRPLEVMRTDLLSILVSQPPGYRKPGAGTEPDPFRMSGETLSLDGQPFSRLTFSSFSHIPSGGSPAGGVARIGYHVRGNAGDGYDLCRSDSLRPFRDDPFSDCDPILFRNVLGFRITFLDGEGKEHGEWDSDSRENGRAFPAALDLVLTLKTPSGPETVRTRLGVPVGREVKE
jgi:general secretion pathway protein J